MKLSKRLETIYELVPQGTFCADIGADHGKLIISLAENNISISSLAVENKIGPFKRLKENISKSKAKDKIKAILSDGIKDIDDNIDTLIIAGMGGDLIINILNKDKDKLANIKYIIVDAHTNSNKLRRYLNELSFTILEEKIVYEAHIFYEIIKLERRDKKQDLDELDIKFGPILRKRKDDLFIKKYQLIDEKILELLNNKDKLGEVRSKELIREHEMIKEVL